MSEWLSINIHGESGKEIAAEYDKQFTRSILDNPRDYTVSCTRFKIPTGSVNAHKITTNDYKVGVFQKSSGGTTFDGSLIDLPLDTEQQINSRSDLLEILNRKIMESFYLKQKTAVEASDDTATFESVGVNYLFTSGTDSNDISIPNRLSPTSSISDNRAAFVTFTMTKYSGNSAMSMKVTTPEGTTIELAHSITMSDNQSLTFTDYSLNRYSNDVVGLSDMQALEPINIKCSNEQINTSTGSFTLTVDSISDIQLEFRVNIAYVYTTNLSKQTTSDALEFPKSAPVFDLTTTNEIDLSFLESWHSSGLFIGVSEKLKNILGFPTKYNSTIDAYEILLDSIVYNSTFDPDFGITQKQLINNSSLLSNLDRIEIRTNLPVNSQISDNNESQGILTDYIIDREELTNNDQYIYYNANSDFRRYDLVSDVELKRLNFSVWMIYADGSSEKLKILNGESMNLLIHFEKINSIKATNFGLRAS